MATTYLTPGVYVEEVPSGSATLAAGATAIAAFVGFTASGPTDDPADPEGRKPRLVTSWTQYEQLYGGFVAGAMLPHSVYGWFNNGGGSCYIVRVPHTKPSEVSGQLSLPAADRALGQPVEIATKVPNAPVAVHIRAAEDDGEDPPEGQAPSFDVLVTLDGAEVEHFDGVTLGGGDRNVATVVNAESQHITMTQTTELTDELTAAMFTLKEGNYPVLAAAPTPLQVPTREFSGSESNRTGINGLVIADDVTMVLVPDLVNAARKEDGSIDLGTWKAVQTALINHCEGQANRIAILDAPPGMGPRQIKEWRSDVAMYDSAFATMYYPWIKVDNPLGGPERELLVPPSGHMAGIWARNDDTRGVWKAPANEIVRGALDVELALTKAEQAHLNPIGINCIRPFGTRGIRVWGARTLASDSDWKYVNVRRLFNMIEKTILDGTQWVVFEPNDQKLWEGVKRTISSFLRGLWRDGALFGATPDQAFYVKCDAETNPPDSIDAGKLVVEVGIAPVKPAEFVIFRISQFKDLNGA